MSLPIAWLFSLSSSSLLYATWLHVAAWAVVEDGRLFFLEHFGKLGAPGTGRR